MCLYHLSVTRFCILVFFYLRILCVCVTSIKVYIWPQLISRYTRCWWRWHQSHGIDLSWGGGMPSGGYLGQFLDLQPLQLVRQRQIWSKYPWDVVSYICWSFFSSASFLECSNSNCFAGSSYDMKVKFKCFSDHKLTLLPIQDVCLHAEGCHQRWPSTFTRHR